MNDGPHWEPVVGAVRVLRSFVLSDDGALLPLTPVSGGQEWVDGENRARCSRGAEHQVPDENCTCGFYAYGHQNWVDTQSYPWFADIEAVVECYGKVILAERGVRASNARIVAVSLSKRVPTALVALLQQRYPSITVYRSPSAMLAQHELSGLDTYGARSVSAAGWVEHYAARVLPLAPLWAGIPLGLQPWALLPLAVVVGPLAWVGWHLTRTGRLHPVRVLRVLLFVFIVTQLLRFGLAQGNAWVIGAGALLAVALTAVDGALALPMRLSEVMMQTFRPRPRAGPLDALAGLASLGEAEPEVIEVEPPALANNVLVRVLRYEQCSLAFLQPLDPDSWRDEQAVMATCQPWLEGTARVDGAVLVMPGPRAHAAHPAQGKAKATQHQGWVVGASLPLAEVAPRLGLPGGVWVPSSLMVGVVVMLQYGQEPGGERLPFTIPGLPRFTEGSDPAVAITHAVGLASRRHYQEVQTEIAAAGVVPMVAPALPLPIPDVDPERLGRGWGQIMAMTGPGALVAGSVHEVVEHRLPEQARVRHLPEQAEDIITALQARLAQNNYRPVIGTAGAVSATARTQRWYASTTVLGCYAHGGVLAVLCQEPRSNTKPARLVLWAMPGVDARLP